MRGVVKWFNQVKGYGFILPEKGGKEIFVHYTGIEGTKDIRRNLDEGAKVEYDVAEGDKGPKAVAVKVVIEG